MGIMNARKAVRGPVNELDKCTVVSIFPEPLKFHKPTIEPGLFQIGGGSYKKPAILVVGSSSWWMDVNENLVEIPTGAPQVANSIVVDHCLGLHGVTQGIAQPGLFWILGEKTVDTILKENKAELDKYKVLQDNWYSELVKQADVLWARSNGNPLAISNYARLAVQELGLKDKAWMRDFNTLQLTNCPACGSLRNPEYPICGTCKTVVDKPLYEKLQLKQAV